MTKTKTIPIIDISPYLDPNASADTKDRVINQVEQACSTYGFLQVKGHGVPLDIQRSMLQCCKTLFDLPIEEKEALSLKNSPSRRGYEKIGDQILDSKALPDHKEGFYIGREVPPEDLSFLRGPNQWPSLSEQEFHTPVTEYYAHMLRLNTALIEMLVLALGQPTSVLEKFTQEPVMNLKLLHYPKHESDDPLQFGAGEHTDFGAITTLLQQPGAPGLQVYDITSTSSSSPEEDKWMDVPAEEDIFVVNIGDLIDKWTGGKYTSTLHRVINKAGGDRYSVPCFYHGDLQATNPFAGGDRYSTACFYEGDLKATNAFMPEVNDETVEEHIRRKFDSSYGFGKEKR